MFLPGRVGLCDRRIRPTDCRLVSQRQHFVFDALEQALYALQPARSNALVLHGDRGSQYVSIRYTERLF